MQIVVLQGTDRKLSQLQISSTRLVALGEVEFDFMADQVSLSVGGNNDSLLYLQNLLEPDFLAYVQITNENLEHFRVSPVLAQKLSQLNISKKRQWWKYSLITLFLLTCITILFLSRNSWSGFLAQAIPFSLERKLADNLQISKMTEAQKKVSADLEHWASKLQVDKKEWPYPFRMKIVSDSSPNAFATLGGYISVHTGLIKLSSDPRELLAVLAHEMSHVKHRHVMKSWIQALGIYGITSILFGDLLGVSAAVVNSGGELMNLSYSRALEEEADAEAVELLRRSGIPSEYLARVFEKMRDYNDQLKPEGQVGKVIEKFEKIEMLSTHPLLSVRIKKIRLLGNSVSSVSYEKEIENYEKFKAEIRNTF